MKATKILTCVFALSACTDAEPEILDSPLKDEVYIRTSENFPSARAKELTDLICAESGQNALPRFSYCEDTYCSANVHVYYCAY